VVDLDELSAASSAQPIPADFDAEKAPNAAEIEQQFAVVCMEFAEKHFKLISNIQASKLPRMTQFDDEILAGFEQHFPELANNDKLKKLSEDELKNPKAKERWREFMHHFEKKVQDFNFGTLIRSDCTEDYTESNSFFALRLQFYAIEIARNRRGLNDVLCKKQ